MSIKTKSRFYYNNKITIAENILLKNDIFHHLATVLRAKKADYILLYNESDGEYLCQIEAITKNSIEVTVQEVTKKPSASPTNIICAFAPLKKDANDFILEKCTELDTHGFINVITERTVNKPLDKEKIAHKVILAANQCGRLSIPKIYSPLKLSELINSLTTAFMGYKIIWACEKNIFPPLLEVVNNQKIPNVILFVGPEGGFTDNEINLLSTNKNIYPIHLKTNILRAETALLTTLINFKIFNGSL